MAYCARKCISMDACTFPSPVFKLLGLMDLTGYMFYPIQLLNYPNEFANFPFDALFVLHCIFCRTLTPFSLLVDSLQHSSPDISEERAIHQSFTMGLLAFCSTDQFGGGLRSIQKILCGTLSSFTLPCI